MSCFAKICQLNYIKLNTEYIWENSSLTDKSNEPIYETQITFFGVSTLGWRRTTKIIIFFQVWPWITFLTARFKQTTRRADKSSSVATNCDNVETFLWSTLGGYSKSLIYTQFFELSSGFADLRQKALNGTPVVFLWVYVFNRGVSSWIKPSWWDGKNFLPCHKGYGDLIVLTQNNIHRTLTKPWKLKNCWINCYYWHS